jgi:soluble lytic murein transglycosylase-like protein
MQFMPATARRYGLRNPHEPLSSIDAAARYVRDLSRRFGGRRDLILAAYNAGEYAVIRAGYNVPRYRETRQYVARGTLLMNRTNPPIQQTQIAKAVESQPLIKSNPSRQSIYITRDQEPPFRLPNRPSAAVTRSLYFNDR